MCASVTSQYCGHPIHHLHPGIWAKHSNFHLATNAPFAVHVPGTQPQVSSQYAEFVDLFPTIVEAATGNIMPACPKRSCNVKFCTQGVSLLPHIKDHRFAGLVARLHVMALVIGCEFTVTLS